MDVSKKTEISNLLRESNCELLKNWTPSKRENSPDVFTLQTGKHDVELIQISVDKRNASMKLCQVICKDW